jgi:hypothetical protein
MPLIKNQYPDVRKYRDDNRGEDVFLQPGEERSISRIPAGTSLLISAEQIKTIPSQKGKKAVQL